MEKVESRGFMRFAAKTALVFVLLLILERILMPKYTGTVVEGNFTSEYYRDETPHDLIIVGNCESYENISPMVLWEEYGITSYIRGNANQLIPQSYVLLKETLKHEMPKAVILNIQAMTVEGQSTEEYNRMVFDGMKWSAEKLEGIRASCMSDEKLIEYIFPILRFKSRLFDLGADDVRYAFSEKPLYSYNGYYLRADIRPYDESAFPYERRREDYSFPKQNMEYLKKITDLCQSNGVRLILMKAPSAYPVWAEPYEEQIVSFAEENGLTYLNTYEHDEIGIDLKWDTYDGGLHLNVYGAEKLSRWLGAVLKEEIGLEDHRGDPALSAAYDARLNDYTAEKEEQMAEFEALGYISKYTDQ